MPRQPREIDIFGPDGGYRVTTMEDAYRVAAQRTYALQDQQEITEAAERLAEDSDPDPYGYQQEIENEFGLNVLDLRWKARPEEPMWIKRTTARARKAVVAKLFLQGFKPPEISHKVGVTEVTVMSDIKNIQEDWRKSYLSDIELLCSKDLDRLEYYLTKLAPGIENGDTKAINSAVEIIKERGNVLGYRQGMQVDIEQYVREVAEANGFNPDTAVQMAQRVSIRFRP